MTSISDSQGRYVAPPAVLLERFLLTGNLSPQYQVNNKFASFPDATINAVKTMFDALADSSMAVFKDIVTRDAAPKKPPVLLAYAAALTSIKSRKEAEALYGAVVRTGTDALVLTSYLTKMRGKGRAYRRHVGKFFEMAENIGDRFMATQFIKYRNRADWTLRDMLRVSHFTPKNEETHAFLKFAINGTFEGKSALLHGHLFVNQPGRTVLQVVSEIQALREESSVNLPWESLPTELLSSPEVWDALRPGLGFTALMRNLARFARLGLKITDDELDRLANPQNLHYGCPHPVNFLSAWRTYSQGKGERGTTTWNPDQRVNDALEAGFYNSFKNLKPSDKKIFFGLDISGSMGWTQSTVVGLNCREVAAAMVMAAIRQQPYALYGFSHNLIELDIRKHWGLDEVMNYMDGLPFGATNCSLPMQFAANQKIQDVDLFAIYTDNDTNSSRGEPPFQALERYRSVGNPNASFAAVACAGNAFTISNPNDWGSMDFCGFDSGVPGMLTDLAEKRNPLV